VHVDIYEGNGPVILFIPGMGCYAGIYGEFLEQFSSRGFTVIGIDLPGHGRSGGLRGRFCFSNVIEAVSDLAAYAEARFNDRIGLMGTSLGGTYALYAALHESRIRAVLCHNAMDITTDLHVPTRFPILTRFMISCMRPAARLISWLPIPLRVLVDWSKVIDDPALMATLLRDPLMVWTYTLGSWASFLDYAPKTNLNRMETPVKIVVGMNDRLFPPEFCRSLSRRIGRNGAIFEVIPGGHALPLESLPALIHVAADWFEQKLSG
jgi:alpha-beta hydrolase superfamily lysophospholipase